MPLPIHIGVDVGGTFTDLAVHIPGSDRYILHKLPSTPDQPDRAIVEGVRSLLAENALDPKAVRRFSHGTTAGTNALIQRRCGKVGIVTTAGFRDLLEIGRQIRPKVYNIHEDFPAPLVPRWLRLEVAERMRADGVVHTALDEAGVEQAGARLAEEGVDSIVVCFLHAHAYPAHEDRAAEILRRSLGERIFVITSSSVYPEFREYERFSTAVLNAALLSVISTYLDRLTRSLEAVGIGAELTVSQSAGGLMSIARAREFPIRSALSGPAAGVAGAAYRAKSAGFGNIITLDVGGTSADVSLLVEGEPALVHSRRLAGFPLRLPTLDVNAVGAGGGSIAWIDRDGLLKVGPHSAGARPGPACYDLGGEEATVTDANVLLGRLPGDALLDGRMPIRPELAERAIANLAGRLGLDLVETAVGIVQIACATIVKAIRSISVERGYDPGDFALFAFGGAGPLHAPDIARELRIGRVIIPPNPGILCAEGLLSSDLAADFVHTALCPLNAAAGATLNAARDNLQTLADAYFQHEGVAADARRILWSADLRYHGQNFELSIPFDAGDTAGFNSTACAGLLDDFHAAHENSYGFAQPGEPVEFVSMRIKLTGMLDKPALPQAGQRRAADPVTSRQVAFAKDLWRDAPVYRRSELAVDQALLGPAIVEQLDSTTLLFPGDRCRVDAWDNLIVELQPVESVL